MLDWIACALVRVIGGLLCLLPAPAAVWLGERLGIVGYWLQPARTRIGLLNLRAAFDGTLAPAQASRIIRAYYRNLGASVVELLRLPVIDQAYVDRHVAFEGRPRLEEAAASGKPVILITGHYGNWELCSIVAALIGHPITALARAQEHFPRLYRLLVSYRESKGCAIVHKGGGVRRLVAALEQGRCIGIVGDQVSRQGIFVDFFGRPALFARGPFELAFRKGAVMLPAFIHRVRGPCHRITIEPPIRFAPGASEEEAVRDGIEQFAAVLARHISADPAHWLWMHKRWKHTSARRVLILSDGKLGHLKQSQAVVEALREQHPALSSRVVEVRYRHRLGRLLAMLWGGWGPRAVGGTRCLSVALTKKTQSALLGRYADLVISCGTSLAPVNLLWAADNRARSLVIMNPSPLPLRRFDLVIAPRHDRLPSRANVIPVAGALAPPLGEERLFEAASRLRAHPKFRAHLPLPRHPAIAVLIGGDTPHYALSQAVAGSLINHVQAACERADGWCLVTTSRRTSPAVEATLAARLERDPRCRLLLMASRDALDLPAPPVGGAQAGGTLEGMLGLADLIVVTGESISMVSEACASGRLVVVVEPAGRRARAAGSRRHRRFLHELARDGYARLAPVEALGQAIQSALGERRSPKRLDDWAALREPLRRLL